jgi:HD-GYP domain-containing protein (c-di-GMP phosphodiesterase class II)
MELMPIATVMSQLRVGQPLRWGIRDERGVLLLARGFMVSAAIVQSALITRGAFVDATEVEFNLADLRCEEAALDAFIGCWERLISLIRSFSVNPDRRGLVERVSECVKHLQALTELNTDLMIFLILRQDQSRFAHYGFFHALHVAAICGLASQRLQWDAADRIAAMSAALTMNLSIAELQGVLAMQRSALSEQQFETIRQHPLASAELLRSAGVSDEKWLAAVEQHHEVAGGAGYPRGLAQPSDISQLLRYADIYAAKLSMRATRGPQLPDLAARVLFSGDNASPLIAAIIKEFGLYPPGSYVRLASGETAIVLRGGPSAAAPVVAALTNVHGDALAEPVLRETTEAAHTVIEAVADIDGLTHPTWQTLYEIGFSRNP